MVSLSISRSPSLVSSPSQNSFKHALPSPSDSHFNSTSSTSSSSSSSSHKKDDEDMTITASRSLMKLKSTDKSKEALHLLALSTRITELSYSISDIQTRIFEIQELRHKSQSSADSKDASGVIDQSLSSLDERLETVTAGIKSVNGSLEPLLKAGDRTSVASGHVPSEETLLLRKHSAMLSEWEALQKEIQVLREELKEDKWLTVFRTVTDQADGMMSSLEKAVNRCQEFIWKVQSALNDAGTPSVSSVRSEKSPVSFDTFQSLLDSFEAKKKHYMPATTKVLSIIDKGVQDRVTKNGECLRRHAESTQRWHNLRERIARTDAEMGAVRRVLTGEDISAASSEAGSSTSGTTSKSRPKNGFLQTPQLERSSKERTHSSNTLSRSISPFRRFAKKFTSGGSHKPPPGAVTPTAPASPKRVPSSEPGRSLRHRASMLHFMGGSTQPVTPVTPSHKHSHSLTPESSPSAKRLERMEMNTTLKHRPAWNSSTKVQDEDRSGTVKLSPGRPSTSSSMYRRSDDIPLVPPLYNRSASRSSMASSRPWSPVTSSVSTAQSSTTPFSMYRPPSRSNTPGLPMSYRPPSRSQAQTPGLPMEPRSRLRTPSHIPAPSKPHWSSMSSSPSDTSRDGDDSLLQRAFSPTSPRSHTPGGSVIPARPPSRSMIPIPSVQVMSASRPGTSMDYFRPDSSMSFRTSADGARTPDILKAMRATPRLSMPPSSFRESASPRTPGQGSRPPSRSGAGTPSGERDGSGVPVYEYVPVSTRDPLDMEIANVVNSLAHGLIIKRNDPPLRGTPKENDEIRAQYSFAGPLTTKIVTCKLTTLSRPGASGKSKRVMCRVGGGWQDLRMYVLSRQT
ncbi:uncharacterized protein C8Q71DRAFT_482912 [Rhodofomes roseus]|uniref:GAR domain-containing protein n=2 Tax=Rhodofomes roseus TaxID=34475 RepID=A0ABQ8KQ30_9APHY|nr:uncharacterized protein C8Q71DRAFT_482912 [Rhodofomes roseus]KAH9840250.1 hypothetical protein C8Q71DRAFT_482912 [Rhodofomes roseus]